MTAAYFLVLYIYAGTWAKGDSVTMTVIPQASEQQCKESGRRSVELVRDTLKEMRFMCIKGDKQ